MSKRQNYYGLLWFLIGAAAFGYQLYSKNMDKWALAVSAGIMATGTFMMAPSSVTGLVKLCRAAWKDRNRPTIKL